MTVLRNGKKLKNAEMHKDWKARKWFKRGTALQNSHNKSVVNKNPKNQEIVRAFDMRGQTIAYTFNNLYSSHSELE